MDHYQRKMRKHAIIWTAIGLAALLYLLYGCASLAVAASPQTVQGYCVPESIYSAWTWEAKTRQPSRIAVSRISEGIDHAQAQGWDGERWIYLTSLNGEVREWQRHFQVEPYRYVNLDEWVSEQGRVRR